MNDSHDLGDGPRIHEPPRLASIGRLDAQGDRLAVPIDTHGAPGVLGGYGLDEDIDQLSGYVQATGDQVPQRHVHDDFHRRVANVGLSGCGCRKCRHDWVSSTRRVSIA